MLEELNTYDKMRDASDLLLSAQACWDALRQFRMDRETTRNWVMGKQWNDMVDTTDERGCKITITEEEYIRQQGGYPLKQNLMAMQMNNVIGQFRSNPTATMVVVRNKQGVEAEEMLSNALMSALDINDVDTIDAAMLREFLSSGCAAQKLRWDYLRERDIFDVVIDNVNPARLFFTPETSDPRGTDITMIGEILDYDINTLLTNTTICKSGDDEQLLRQWYSVSREKYRSYYHNNALDSSAIDRLGFLLPMDMQLCRVIEVWYLVPQKGLYLYDMADGSRGFTNKTEDEIVEQNTARILQARRSGIPDEEVPLVQYEVRPEQKWHCTWLTPCGHVLWQGESPYAHQSHPYVLRLHPLTDGEVYGFMRNSIDQQRSINRSMLRVDQTMQRMLKLAVDQSAMEGTTREQLEWELKMPDKIMVMQRSEVDRQRGVDPTPKQVFPNLNHSVLQYYVGIQQQLIEQVSGIHGAIQGRTAGSGVSGKLYAQETANASLNTMDVIQSFTSFLEARSRKALRIAMQFYENRRPIVTFDYKGKRETIYDPQLVKDADADIKVIQSSDTPVYRAAMDEQLMQWAQAQLIPPLVALKAMSSPQAKEIVMMMEQEQQKQMETQQQMMQQQQSQQPSPQQPPQ